MKTKQLEKLEGVDEVIDAFGAKAELMRVTQVTSTQAVSNWSARHRFPPQYYVVMIAWLEEHGFTADPSLWGQLPADDSPPPKEAAPTADSAALT